MTKDQAISIQVRLESAIVALKSAVKVPIPDEEDAVAERVGECLQEALQAAEIGLVELKKVVDL